MRYGIVDIEGRIRVKLLASALAEAAYTPPDGSVAYRTDTNEFLFRIAGVWLRQVNSFNSRTGVVLPADADYAASQIVNDSLVVGPRVSDALNNLAAAITPHPVTSVFARTGAVVALAGDYAAFYVPLARLLTAGAGLTGGGDLSADRTFDVGANADGSILVNANDIQVGVLATDVQHGVRGGGTQHALATALAAGFMSAADFTKLAGISTGSGTPILSWGNNSVSSTTTTRYLEPWFDDTLAPTSPTQYRILRAGTLTNARVRHNTAAGNGLDIGYTLRVNNVGTALSILLASTSQDSAVDASTVAVVPGDLVDIEVTKAASVGASPTNCLFMCEYRG